MAQGSNPSLSAIYSCNALIYKDIIFTGPSMGPSWDHPTRNHHPNRTQCVQRYLNHRLSSGADMLVPSNKSTALIWLKFLGPVEKSSGHEKVASNHPGNRGIDLARTT